MPREQPWRVGGSKRIYGGPGDELLAILAEQFEEEDSEPNPAQNQQIPANAQLLDDTESEQTVAAVTTESAPQNDVTNGFQGAPLHALQNHFAAQDQVSTQESEQQVGSRSSSPTMTH